MSQLSGAPRAQPSIKPREDRRFLAIGMMLLAYLTFTGIDSSAKWLVLQGMPSTEVVLSRYAIQAFIVLALFLPRFGLSVFRTSAPGLEIWRALFLLSSTAFNFFAVLYLPLTVTAAILFTLPFILTGLSIPLLGERVGWRRWAAIVVGFVGVLIIVRPGTDSFHWAMFLSIGSVTTYALYTIATRKLAGVDSSATQQVYAATLATLCILPFGLFNWVWPTDAAAWFAFLAMGVFATIGHLLITVAHRYAEASTLAPFVYPHIIYMTLSSWIIFGQPPDIWIAVGAPIVIGAGLYVWMRERQKVAASRAAQSD